VVDRQVAALVAAVLAGPAIACEHRAARDLAPVRVARDAHVGEQTDHHGPVEGQALRVERPVAPLEDLGAVLEDQDGGAADRADVDRLVRRVQHEHPANRRGALLRPAGPGQRDDRAWFYVTRLGRE
jgi:hypothetical protein